MPACEREVEVPFSRGGQTHHFFWLLIVNINLRRTSEMLYNKFSGADGTAWHCYAVLAFPLIEEHG